LADLYGSVAGTQVAALSVDDAAFVARAIGHGLPEPVGELLASLGRAIRERQFDQITGDVEQLTGRKPVSVREVLETGGVGRKRRLNNVPGEAARVATITIDRLVPQQII
jgi:hypothetical protein